jgi:hypothetical protein
MPVRKKAAHGRPLLYIHQPYCWQVALQHSLLPLQADLSKLLPFNRKITNYF